MKWFLVVLRSATVIPHNYFWHPENYSFINDMEKVSLANSPFLFRSLSSKLSGSFFSFNPIIGSKFTAHQSSNDGWQRCRIAAYIKIKPNYIDKAEVGVEERVKEFLTLCVSLAICSRMNKQSRSICVHRAHS